MITNNYSRQGWRAYVIPEFLKNANKGGYKHLARLERLNNVEIYIQHNIVFVRDKFDSIYG